MQWMRITRRFPTGGLLNDASRVTSLKITVCKEGNTAMTNAKERTVEVTAAYLDALRKAVGRQVDPETAEVDWVYAQTLDPYGDYPDLPPEEQQVGREYFARCPGTDLWINFHDLIDATREALWEKHKRHLAFPAGLEEMHRRMAEGRGLGERYEADRG
jgi:hypothetical protein